MYAYIWLPEKQHKCLKRQHLTLAAHTLAAMASAPGAATAASARRTARARPEQPASRRAVCAEQKARQATALALGRSNSTVIDWAASALPPRPRPREMDDFIRELFDLPAEGLSP